MGCHDRPALNDVSGTYEQRVRSGLVARWALHRLRLLGSKYMASCIGLNDVCRIEANTLASVAYAAARFLIASKTLSTALRAAAPSCAFTERTDFGAMTGIALFTDYVPASLDVLYLSHFAPHSVCIVSN